jgi:hypothetical protein
MLIFSVGERQLINMAINAHGNDAQRAIWRGWASAHPVRHGPADPFDDGTGPFPADVAEVIRSVLNQMFDALHRRGSSGGLSEDELADLSNDLSSIRSVAKSLGEFPGSAVMGQAS